MKELIITEKNEDQRLNKYLERLLVNSGSGFIYRMLRKKNITLNGKKAAGNEILKNGDVIKIFFSDDTYEKLTGKPEEKHVSFPDESRIIYEDPDILIYNKPAGMLTQKAGESDVSVCEYLTGYLMKKGEADSNSLSEYRPSAVNRLDRNTSGLVLCAKNLKAARVLSKMIKERLVKKEYICIVRGKVMEGAGLKGYLKKDVRRNTVALTEDPEDGMYAETAYTPAGFCDTLNASVLMVDLKTGRTHQIRAQLAASGHPLAGDAKYGSAVWNEELKKKYGIRHQLLHAYRLTFPQDCEELEQLSGRIFEAEAPFAYLYAGEEKGKNPGILSRDH